MSATLSRTIALTLASEAAAVAATTWVTRRFAGLYVEHEVDAYFVLRQVLGWVLSVGLFGLNVSLPRALARQREPYARGRQVLAALMLAAPVLAAIALVALVAPRAAARLLLYDAGAAALVIAASLLFAANALFGIAAASLQGLDRFGLLAAFRVVAWAIAPVAVTAFAGGRASLPALLAWWSGAIFVLDAALFLVVARDVRGPPTTSAPPVSATARALFRFGGVRMVGALAQLSSVALAPTLVLWCGGDARAAAAFSVAAMFTMLLAPVRLALQPVALTQLAALDDDDPRARRLAIDYTAVALCAAAGATAALAMSADRLVGLWLGGRYAAEAAALRLSILVIGLHFLCYTLEGALDPKDERDARPQAQLAAAAVFVVGVMVAAKARAGWPGVLAAQLVAAAVQTALYLVVLARRYGLPAARELVHGAVTVGIACGLVGLVARRSGSGARGTLVLVGAEAATAIVFVALARAAGARWPGLVLGNFRSERRPPCAASAAPSASTAAPSRPGSSSG
ncbi:MAG TPA: hypothetical protein VN947_05230 [Polyangia bacterium]|nr:hypothetical protein [Polyangia bacterium]